MKVLKEAIRDTFTKSGMVALTAGAVQTAFVCALACWLLPIIWGWLKSLVEGTWNYLATFLCVFSLLFVFGALFRFYDRLKVCRINAAAEKVKHERYMAQWEEAALENVERDHSMAIVENNAYNTAVNDITNGTNPGQVTRGVRVLLRITGTDEMPQPLREVANRTAITPAGLTPRQRAAAEALERLLVSEPVHNVHGGPPPEAPGGVRNMFCFQAYQHEGDGRMLGVMLDGVTVPLTPAEREYVTYTATNGGIPDYSQDAQFNFRNSRNNPVLYTWLNHEMHRLIYIQFRSLNVRQVIASGVETMADIRTRQHLIAAWFRYVWRENGRDVEYIVRGLARITYEALESLVVSVDRGSTFPMLLTFEWQPPQVVPDATPVLQQSIQDAAARHTTALGEGDRLHHTLHAALLYLHDHGVPEAPEAEWEAPWTQEKVEQHSMFILTPNQMRDAQRGAAERVHHTVLECVNRIYRDGGVVLDWDERTGTMAQNECIVLVHYLHDKHQRMPTSITTQQLRYPSRRQEALEQFWQKLQETDEEHAQLLQIENFVNLFEHVPGMFLEQERRALTQACQHGQVQCGHAARTIQSLVGYDVHLLLHWQGQPPHEHYRIHLWREEDGFLSFSRPGRQERVATQGRKLRLEE